jgi:hypothetical protein
VEYYFYIGRGNKKGWRVLCDEKLQYRTFGTIELAYTALVRQHAEWQRELGNEDQTFEVVDMVNNGEKRLGRVSPFYYRPAKYHEELESLDEMLRDALIGDDDGRRHWLLDIRYDPKPVSSFLAGLTQSKQYKHTKDLGLVNERLSNPEPALHKIMQIMRDGHILILLSDDQAHVKQVETKVREEAQKQGIALEDPYQMNAGDLCRYNAPANSRYAPLWANGTEVFLALRTGYVYRFLVYDLNEDRSNSVDIRDLVIVESGKYRCDKCKKGEKTVTWHEPASQKLCRHCFWQWGLDHGE